MTLPSERPISTPHSFRYVPLKGVSADEYDDAVLKADEAYKERMHNICCNNCHHHVADVLNELKYEGRDNWTQFSVWWMCLTRSKYVS